MRIVAHRWKFFGLLVTVAALPAIPGDTTPQGESPRVAYVRQGTLYVTTASGKVLKTVKPQVGIQDFAISPDASRVVFSVTGKRRYGGPIYMLNVSTGHLAQLTAGLRYATQLASGEQEVYDEPDFSPEGDRIVFDVHYENQGDANDVVMASGPLAVMDLKTRHARILQATKNVDGHGPAFANNPLWSPNGERILVDFEVGAALVSSDGAHLIDLSDQLAQGRDNVEPGAFGWFGSGCVIYFLNEENRGGPSAPHQEVRILHLKTKSTEPASTLLGVPIEMLTKADGVEVSGDLALVRSKSESLVFDVLSRKIIQRLPTSNARLVGGGRVEPGRCD